MSPSQRMPLGRAAMALAATLVFVAWERYAANAADVEARNAMGAGAMFGGGVALLAGASRSDS